MENENIFNKRYKREARHKSKCINKHCANGLCKREANRISSEESMKNKVEDKKSIVLRLNNDIYLKIKKLSEAYGISLHEMIITAINRFVDEKKGIFEDKS